MDTQKTQEDEINQKESRLAYLSIICGNIMCVICNSKQLSIVHDVCTSANTT